MKALPKAVMYITGLYRLSHVLGLSVRILRSLRDNIPRQCEGNVCSFIRHLPDKASYFYLRYRPLILVAMATACILLVYNKAPSGPQCHTETRRYTKPFQGISG